MWKPENIPASDASKSLAIAVMCCGVAFLAINDAIVKWLVTRYDPFQIVFVRSTLALPLVTALVCFIESPRALKSSGIGVHVLRGVLGVAASYVFIRSLNTLPLAEATALVFSAPLFVAALSVMLLKEHVGLKRALALCAGFIGVLIIVRPGTATFQSASILAVLAAVLYAVIMISARWIDKRDSLWTLMLYMSLFSAVFTAFAIVLPWPAPTGQDAALFLGTAVTGTLGLTLISQAYRLAPATVVAPFDYTALIWASGFGWLIWGVVPGVWSYVGAGVIITGGIYLIYSDPQTN